jgi:serine/threonine protein kinase
MPISDRPQSDLIGQDIGPYHLVRRLGVGGMAEAFEAIRQGPSGFTQHVCLKLVLPFFQDDEDFIRLFEREARLAARLRHRNIVGVIDFGETDGRLYMALELVDGTDLRFLLDQQPLQRLSVEQVALVGVELAEALEHAHGRRSGSGLHPTETSTQGIVHRDISPSNVLISRQGEVLLTDFGVAKAMSGGSRGPSAVKGKVPYMAPEQLRAEPLDGRADLFSLGVVLFEALAGGRPYQGAHDPATIMLILDGERAALSKAAPEVPPRLCEVIDSLLEPDRENRPKSASAVLELLDEYTPSPRIRRSLGELAAESRLEADRRRAEVSAIVADGPTKRGPGSAPGDTGTKSARVIASRSEASDLRPEAPEAHSDEPPEDGRVAPDAAGWSRRRLAQAIFGSVLGVAGVGAIGLALWRSADEALQPEGSRSAPPSPEPEVSDPIVEESADVAETPAHLELEEPTRVDPTESKPVRVREPARLSVVVFPWGTVWVNGKKLGSAPIRNKSMKPGRYQIGAGQGSPSKTATIRLRSGQHETVRFDLTQ